MTKKKNYNDWTKEDLIKEVEALKKQKTYGLVWEKDKTKEVFDYYINWDGIKNREKFAETEGKFPVLKEIKNKDITTEKKGNYNLLIEGDNYHALAVLNFTHEKAIDVIYIDPPYNTGNGGFTYNDKLVDSTDAYRHSKWLSFMGKRLMLAKNLLKESGIILISINNIELAQLKLLCDEIFLDNLLGIIIWRNKTGGGKQGQDVEGKREKKEALNTDHEYILVYGKNRKKVRKLEDSLSETEKAEYVNTDNDPRKEYKLRDMEEGIPGIRENNYYEVKDPDGVVIKPGGGKLKWRFIEEEFKRKLKDKSIVWIKRKCKTTEDKRGYYYRPMVKQYLYGADGEERTKILRSIFYNIAYTADGTDELKQILGENFDKFQFPKPSKLIKELIAAYHNKNAVVLDFFAGTGTTGHAVLELNKEDGGERTFILGTNNENNICTEVCYPRLGKVINGYKNIEGEKVEGLGGNLRYFKTDFVDSAPTDRNKKRIVDHATEMICIKENAFEMVKDSGEDYKIFRNHTINLGIIFNSDAIEDFVKEAKKKEGKFHVYVFSLDDTVPEHEFKEIRGRVTLCAIPEAILHVYRRVFKNDTT